LFEISQRFCPSLELRLFCLKNIQQVAKKLESCRQTWYSFLGNEAQRRS